MKADGQKEHHHRRLKNGTGVDVKKGLIWSADKGSGKLDPTAAGVRSSEENANRRAKKNSWEERVRERRPPQEAIVCHTKSYRYLCQV
jgi:hypothetical protein